MSRCSRICIIAACGLLAAQVGASLLFAPGFLLNAFSDINQSLLLLLGILAFLRNVLRSQGRVRVFWALVSLGVGFWFLYQLLWSYFEIVLRQDVPDPFTGDVIIFLHIVPMMAGLAVQPHLQQDERTTRLGSLDFALLLVWWIYLYVYTVFPWQYATVNTAAYDHNLNTIYLTEKVAFLVALALVWWRTSGNWRVLYAHWFAASFLYSVSSDFANWAIARHVYYSGSLYDVPLTAAIAWFTVFAAMGHDIVLVGRPSPRVRPRGGAWVARLGMGAILSLPLFAAWSVFEHKIPPQVRTFRLVTALVCMMLMGALVFLKQTLLDGELLRLLKSSRESFDDLRRLQAQLVQSEKLASLGQLAGGAAHELNNPITAMLGYCELLQGTDLAAPKLNMADAIAGQVRRAGALVASLLTFAKQVPAGKTAADLNALTQTAVNLCRLQLRARNLTAETILAPNLSPILADSNQLMQVMLHLINDMASCAPAGGNTLRVTTLERNGVAVCELTNSPVEMFSANEANASAPANESSSQPTALGLSVCYGIVQDHNGKLLSRKLADGGTIFTLEFPIVAKKNLPAGAALPSSRELLLANAVVAGQQQ